MALTPPSHHISYPDTLLQVLYHYYFTTLPGLYCWFVTKCLVLTPNIINWQVTKLICLSHILETTEKMDIFCVQQVHRMVGSSSDWGKISLQESHGNLSELPEFSLEFVPTGERPASVKLIVHSPLLIRGIYFVCYNQTLIYHSQLSKQATGKKEMTFLDAFYKPMTWVEGVCILSKVNRTKIFLGK